jgi:exopolyphosphatase / guanosine-5'-triphosphate,3'-diphosphate pyrophosphatase
VLEDLEHGAIGTRLGQGLDGSGPLEPEARARTLAVVRTFAQRVAAHGAQVSAIATSAMRRASDAGAFAAEVEAVLGVPLQILSGESEAACSFRGATARAPLPAGSTCAVLDIGGGSTECAVGSAGQLRNGLSLELGTVRITERFPDLSGRAPGAPALAAAAAARTAMAGVLEPLRALGPVDEVRAVAGTPLTLGAVAFTSSVERVSGQVLARAAIDALVERMLGLDLAARKALPGMLAQRADVLPAGGLILSEALGLLGCTQARLESDDLLLGYLLGTMTGGDEGATRGMMVE